MNEIITERLILKPLTKKDDVNLFELHSDKQVMHFIRNPDEDIFQTKKKILETLRYSEANKSLGLWCAFDKVSDVFIGWGVLVHIEHNVNNPIELGFRLHTKYWMQGFGSEIAQALIHYACGIKLTTIVGITSEDNIGSQKTLEKTGFHFVEKREFYNQEVLYYKQKLNLKKEF
jgi:ribosomal-protein-alanine N-acetyltransferase